MISKVTIIRTIQNTISMEADRQIGAKSELLLLSSCGRLQSFNVWYLFPDGIPFNASNITPLTVADYGYQDGGFSVPLFKQIIGINISAMW